MIDYDEEWIASLLCRAQGSVMPKAFVYSMPAMILAVLITYLDEWMPGLREDLGLLDWDKSQIWTAVTTVVTAMVSFRTSQAWGRFWEGTGLLHQMRGEWFDTVSNCVTFSIASKDAKLNQVMNFRHCIIRIMSLCHGSALEEIAGNQIEMESIDVFGLSDATLAHLQNCHTEYHFNKVEVMLHLLQSLITKSQDDGVLKVPPPILSRVYQTISRGFVNLLNAKKIQDTKFPFPYAQLISALLLVLSCLTPIMMTTLLKSKVMATIATFIPIFGLFCLNFVAQELEDPFGIDNNDLPLQNFQTEMNNCLMMLLHPNADLIADVGPRCEMDFHTLLGTIHTFDDAEEEEEEQARLTTRKTKRLSEFGATMSEEESASRTSGASKKFSRSQSKRLSEFSMPPLSHSPSGGRLPANDEEFREMMEQSLSSLSAMGVERSVSVVAPEDVVPELSGGSAVPVEASQITAELENLTLWIGQEPVMSERHSPRTDEPKLPWEPSSRENTVTDLERMAQIDADDGLHYNIRNLADLQPVLARSMDDLIRSLEDWSRNVHSEVNNLNQNSVVLQDALKRFEESLPKTNGSAGPAPTYRPKSKTTKTLTINGERPERAEREGRERSI